MRVLIAGCGDVGNVLASSLLQDGHTVFGLKRDTSTLPRGIEPVQADLTRPGSLVNLPGELDRLVYMPTPAGRDEVAYKAIFIQGLKNLLAGLKRDPDRTLLVSSTAVYGETAGGIVDEETLPQPDTFNGRILLQMEQLAAARTKNLVVVRISGIYGPGRERLIRLAVSKGLKVQQSPPYFTNRIHRDDAAAVLKHLLEIDRPQDLYVATDNLPAPRYDVIAWLAKVQGQAVPAGITDETASRGKRINNQRLRDSGFHLAYPDYRSGYGSVLGLPAE